MGDPSLDSVVVLKVKKICCKSYQKKLKKELLRIDGVYSISMDSERNLVTVRGRVDSNLLINAIEKTGKMAEIVHFDHNTSNRKSNNYEESRPYKNVHNKCPHDNNNRAQNHASSHSKGGVIQEEGGHICEAYAPLQIDERICRDFWCKEHKQRPIFRDTAPQSANSGFSFHNSGAPFHFSNNPFPSYLRPGYHRMPPAPGAAYGFHSGRSMPGSGFYPYGFHQ